MIKIFEKAKKYYKEGRWTRRYLEALVAAGKITQAEYDEITGGPYES